MSIPAEVRGKFYALRGLALVLMLAAGADFYFRPERFGAGLVAFAAMAVGLWLVRRSNACVWRARGHVVPKWSVGKAAKRVGPLAWKLTGASFGACVIFYIALYLDEFFGGTKVWPVYAFAIAAVALALTSGYVVMRMFQG